MRFSVFCSYFFMNFINQLPLQFKLLQSPRTMNM